MNIALDPIFIFGLHLGISGAAATALSQCVSFCILLSMFCAAKASWCSPRLFTRRAAEIGRILACGLPSFRARPWPAGHRPFERAGRHVGRPRGGRHEHCGAHFFMFVFSVMLGIGQGFQPVAGYNYGAGKYTRLRQAFRFTLILGQVCMTLVTVGAFFAAPWLVQTFRNDPEVVRIGAFACRLQCCAMLFVPATTCANMLFQSIGESTSATFCPACGRGCIPAAHPDPALYHRPFGVQAAQPAADLLTFLTCIPFLVRFFRRLPRQDKA